MGDSSDRRYPDFDEADRCFTAGLRDQGSGRHGGESLAFNPENLIESVEPDEHDDRERTRQELHHSGRLAASPG